MLQTTGFIPVFPGPTATCKRRDAGAIAESPVSAGAHQNRCGVRIPHILTLTSFLQRSEGRQVPFSPVEAEIIYRRPPRIQVWHARWLVTPLALSHLKITEYNVRSSGGCRQTEAGLQVVRSLPYLYAVPIQRQWSRRHILSDHFTSEWYPVNPG